LSSKSLARETTEWSVTEAPRVSLADIEAAVGFRYDATVADILGDGTFANCVLNGPAGPPLREVFICVLVTWGGLVVVGKHATDDDRLGRDLAYRDAVQQLWSLIGMAPKGTLDERYGIDAVGWAAWQKLSLESQ
jgi:hypothetical protein